MILEVDESVVRKVVILSVCCGCKKGKRLWLERKVFDFVFVKIVKMIEEEIEFGELLESEEEDGGNFDLL